MAKKVQPSPATEPEAPVYRYRFTEGDTEFAVREDGNTVVLRYPGMTVGDRVRPRDERHGQQRGYVRALLPGWGPSPIRVIALVEFDVPVVIRDPLVRNPKTPVRFWPADDLEVIP